MVVDVDHDENDPERVLALELLDAIVDILWVQFVVLERQKESAGCETEQIVGRDVAILPRHGLEGGEDGVAFLARRHDDGAWAVALGESLWCRLGYA